jgi:YHS domain-containing protein
MTRHPQRETRVRLNALAIFAGLSLVALSRTPVRAGHDPNGIPWRTDLGTAQVEAKEKNLVLWLQFTGPWCPNCRRLDRGAFVHPAVVSSSREQFVPIKLRSDEFEGLALSLGLSVLPSTVLVRPNGEVINKLEGYADPNEFYSFLQQSLLREGRIGNGLASRDKKPVPPAPVPIALASYCPVALVNEHKLVASRTDLFVQHLGREYRFATAAAKSEFLRQPERFVPVNNGASPVCQVDGGDCRPGDPRWGVTYKGRLFLCADAQERDLFLLNPERYSQVGAEDRARLGDRRGLWALIRPGQSTAPYLNRTIQTEPLLIQALRAPLDSLRR